MSCACLAADALGQHTADEIVDSGHWSGATDALIGGPVAAADQGFDPSGAKNAMDPRMTTRESSATATNGNAVRTAALPRTATKHQFDILVAAVLHMVMLHWVV